MSNHSWLREGFLGCPPEHEQGSMHRSHVTSGSPLGSTRDARIWFRRNLELRLGERGRVRERRRDWSKESESMLHYACASTRGCPTSGFPVIWDNTFFIVHTHLSLSKISVICLKGIMSAMGHHGSYLSLYFSTHSHQHCDRGHRCFS